MKYKNIYREFCQNYLTALESEYIEKHKQKLHFQNRNN